MAKIFNICSICLLIALMLDACAPGIANQRSDSNNPQTNPVPIASPAVTNPVEPNPSPTHSTSEDVEDYPPAVWASIKEVALHLGIGLEQVQVISFQEEEWPDSCLGLAALDEMCLQVITPGYHILLGVDDQHYEYRSDQSGEVLRVVGDSVLESNKPGLELEKPKAILAAMRALSQTTGKPIEEIKVISIEAVQWPDSCLGIAMPDEMCAEVITPGWIIRLEAEEKIYEFLTDLRGENIRQKKI